MAPTEIKTLYEIPPDQAALFNSIGLEVEADGDGEDCIRSAAWLVHGDPDNPCGSTIGSSYANHPKFLALALFRTLEQMEYWVDRVQEMYGSAAHANYLKNRRTFIFPSGARVQCDHLNNGDSTEGERYRGCAFQRVLVFDPGNGLTTRGRDNIRNICRSYEKELRPQILYTHAR